MENRLRKQIMFSYKHKDTGLYVSKTFKYPALALAFYNDLTDKEKQKCDMMVKTSKDGKDISYTFINYDILSKLVGSGNKSPKLLKGKKR